MSIPLSATDNGQNNSRNNIIIYKNMKLRIWWTYFETFQFRQPSCSWEAKSEIFNYLLRAWVFKNTLLSIVFKQTMVMEIKVDRVNLEAHVLILRQAQIKTKEFREDVLSCNERKTGSGRPRTVCIEENVKAVIMMI